MTNQTTQTMPAIEAAVNAGLASYHGVKTFSSEVRLRLALEATARAMLAAAPAASGGEVWTREMVADVHRRGEELYRRIHGANPPPAASVSERARELVRRWRECAKSAANGPMFDGASEYAVAGTYIACADELESLLSGGSNA